jgi:tetratricopeptide (TPR) repeat protein
VLARAGGPWSDALATSQEAKQIYRQLTSQDPHKHLPGLALCLENVAYVLARMPDEQKVAAYVQALPPEQAEAYQELLRDRAGEFSQDLAAIGRNVLDKLQHERLSAAQEAVRIRRQLARHDPDTRLPDLASALSNLALYLEAAGQQREALSATQEAERLSRQLAERDPGAHRPRLAMSLHHLGTILMSAGQQADALAAAREATDIGRELAAQDPDTHLPHLAAFLTGLASQLMNVGQQHESRTTAREAVNIRRELAMRDPGAHLTDLVASLRTLADTGSPPEARTAWEAAIVDFADVPSRSYLELALARYLLGQKDASEIAIALLITVLTSPGVPETVVANARALLRGHWGEDRQAARRAWQSHTHEPIPAWLSLTEKDARLIVNWMSMPTWTTSRDFLIAHEEQLLASATNAVLDELEVNLTGSDQLGMRSMLDELRAILATAREQGIDAAYEHLLVGDTLDEWIESPSWEASHAFLQAHPELLGEDALRLLSGSDDEQPDPTIKLHRSLLVLARGPAGIAEAYRCLVDRQALSGFLANAMATHDPSHMLACAVIEETIHHQVFLGAFHAAMGRLATDPAAKLPRDSATRLTALAMQAGTSEIEQAAAELAVLCSRESAESPLAMQLYHALRRAQNPTVAD